jgi:6-phospho-3-hexuloisomerase
MDQGPIAQSGAWLAVGREIAQTLERMDARAFQRFVEVFRDEKRRWFFSGQGRSGLVAEMAAMRFMHMGRTAHFVGEATAPSIRPSDGLCLVSGSGNTPVAVHFARIAKKERAKIALITRKSDSALRNSPTASFTRPSKQRGNSAVASLSKRASFSSTRSCSN